MTNPEATPALLEKHQAILERIAHKLAPEYSLSPQSFTITFKPSNQRGVKLEGGIRPHIVFGVWVDDPEFEYWLRDALQQIEIVKRCGAIDVRTRLNERQALVRELIPHMIEKPRPPRVDEEVILLRRVVVTHRRTGMVSIREAVEGKITWTRLVRLAEEELYEFVEVADRVRKQRNAEKTNQTA